MGAGDIMYIYTKAPVNKLTATVVSQEGCTSHEGFSIDQKRSILLARLKYLKNELAKIRMGNNKDKNIKLCSQIHDTEVKLSELKKHYPKRISDFILDVIKSEVSSEVWDKWVRRAYDKARSIGPSMATNTVKKGI